MHLTFASLLISHNKMRIEHKNHGDCIYIFMVHTMNQETIVV